MRKEVGLYGDWQMLNGVPHHQLPSDQGGVQWLHLAGNVAVQWLMAYDL